MKTKQLEEVNKPSTIFLATCLGERLILYISLCQGVTGVAPYVRLFHHENGVFSGIPGLIRSRRCGKQMAFYFTFNPGTNQFCQ